MEYAVEDLRNNENDIFILSKGHGAAALYVVLEKIGAIKPALIANYGKPEGLLGGHPERFKSKEIMASTGSLGHGLPIAAGVALGRKIQGKPGRIYCLLGDGECQEGTVWESANIAANQKLENLVAIIDWNGSARQLMPLEDLNARWAAFGWNVVMGKGHGLANLANAFNKIADLDVLRPTVLILETVKGKGSALIEGHGAWHHKMPNQSEYRQIMKDLGNE